MYYIYFKTLVHHYFYPVSARYFALCTKTSYAYFLFAWDFGGNLFWGDHFQRTAWGSFCWFIKL